MMQETSGRWASWLLKSRDMDGTYVGRQGRLPQISVAAAGLSGRCYH